MSIVSKRSLSSCFHLSQFVQFSMASHSLEPLFSLHETSWIISYFDFHGKSLEAFLKQYFTYIQELYFPILVKKCELNILKLFARYVSSEASLAILFFFYIHCINIKVK